MQDTALIIPCYNEANRLQPMVFETFVRAQPSLHFVFVDDGSSDATGDIIRALRKRVPSQCSLVQQPTNSGKAEAVRRGIHFAAARGFKYLGYWDADLATPLDAILAFKDVLDRKSEVLLVLGSRVKLLGRDIRRNELRHYCGRVFATCASLVLGLPVYDTQCGAKLFRHSPQILAAFAQPFRTRWVFDVELLARWVSLMHNSDGQRVSDRVVELPLEKWHDIEGSKLRSRDFVIAATDLLRIAMNSRGIRRPH